MACALVGEITWNDKHVSRRDQGEKGDRCTDALLRRKILLPELTIAVHG